MKEINYYDGFESEPEIKFVMNTAENSSVIRMWVGYFDEIMRMIPPVNDEWIGITYQYNMEEGWYDESPWVIPELNTLRNQIELAKDSVTDTTIKSICANLVSMIDDALQTNNQIFIVYE